MAEQPGPDRERWLQRAAEGELRAQLVVSKALETGKLAWTGIGIPHSISVPRK